MLRLSHLINAIPKTSGIIFSQRHDSSSLGSLQVSQWTFDWSIIIEAFKVESETVSAR